MIIPKRHFLLISFTIIPIAIFSVIPYPGILTDVISNFGNTTFWWVVQFSILVIFWSSKKIFFDKTNSTNMLFLNWYLIWNLFSSSRGMFIADGYWDWKALIENTFALLIPIVAYAGTNKILVQSILAYFIKYGLLLFLVIAFLITPGAFGFYLVPVSFLILFFPILPPRWKWIILGLSLLSIFAYLGTRSNLIKYGSAILLMSIYYFRVFLINRIIKLLCLILLIAPLLLFSLAVTGVFNVFNVEEYSDLNYSVKSTDIKGETTEEDLNADTRTLLYVDVLATAETYNSWWFGRSPARGNKSETFAEYDPTGRGERNANEVGILNVFMWTGIIGVILYFAVFVTASNLAVTQSNNIFSKILGLSIAFRWVFTWIEDVNNFSINMFILWLTIGLCFSKSFRQMNDAEVEKWIQNIFV